jgi:hypothetical protein
MPEESQLQLLWPLNVCTLRKTISFFPQPVEARDVRLEGAILPCAFVRGRFFSFCSSSVCRKKMEGKKTTRQTRVGHPSLAEPARAVRGPAKLLRK